MQSISTDSERPLPKRGSLAIEIVGSADSQESSIISSIIVIKEAGIALRDGGRTGNDRRPALMEGEKVGTEEETAPGQAHNQHLKKKAAASDPSSTGS